MRYIVLYTIALYSTIYIYIYIYLNVKVIFEGKKIATLEGFTAQGSNWYQNFHCTIPHLKKNIGSPKKLPVPDKTGKTGQKRPKSCKFPLSFVTVF